MSETASYDDSINSSLSPSRTKFKVILAGEEGVGKSSLFTYWRDKGLYSKRSFTHDSCAASFEIECDRRNVLLEIYDTAGVERYRSMTPNYYRGAKCVLLICSMKDADSLRELGHWVTKASSYAPKALKLLLATNGDVSDKALSETTLRNFCENYDVTFGSIVSSATGKGMDTVLQIIAKEVLLYVGMTSSSEKLIPEERYIDKRDKRCSCN